MYRTYDHPIHVTGKPIGIKDDAKKNGAPANFAARNRIWAPGNRKKSKCESVWRRRRRRRRRKKLKVTKLFSVRPFDLWLIGKYYYKRVSVLKSERSLRSRTWFRCCRTERERSTQHTCFVLKLSQGYICHCFWVPWHYKKKKNADYSL